LEKWERPGKKFEPCPKRGSIVDALWNPCTPEGVKGNKSDLNNVRCEISRHLRSKKLEYLRNKINELAMNSKKRGTSETCIEE
jgi:hypothetical protein